MKTLAPLTELNGYRLCSLPSAIQFNQGTAYVTRKPFCKWFLLILPGSVLTILNLSLPYYTTLKTYLLYFLWFNRQFHLAWSNRDGWYMYSYIVYVGLTTISVMVSFLWDIWEQWRQNVASDQGLDCLLTESFIKLWMMKMEKGKHQCTMLLCKPVACLDHSSPKHIRICILFVVLIRTWNTHLYSDEYGETHVVVVRGLFKYEWK